MEFRLFESNELVIKGDTLSRSVESVLHPCDPWADFARVESRTVRLIGLLVSAVLVLAGCGGGDSADRFVPAPTDAQSALQTALAAWQAGTPTGPVPNTSPLIHVTDSYRRKGEQLVDFRILGETPGDAPRCYAVKLRFDPPREEKARYVIVGIDPLWVFRLEDYQLLAHWEHRMDDGQTPGESAGTEPPDAAERPAAAERSDAP